MGNGRTMSVAFEPLVVGLFEQAVPVPGAVWLFGSALAGIAGLRRRRAA